MTPNETISLVVFFFVSAAIISAVLYYEGRGR